MKKIFITFILFTLISVANARDTISIVGSSTVFPYATIGAERFTEEGYNGATIEPTGTGGGNQKRQNFALKMGLLKLSKWSWVMMVLHFQIVLKLRGLA